MPSNTNIFGGISKRQSRLRVHVANPLAALLLENIELNDAYSVADHVALLEQQYDMPSPDSLFADAVNLVERMRIKGLVLCRAKAG